MFSFLVMSSILLTIDKISASCPASVSEAYVSMFQSISDSAFDESRAVELSENKVFLELSFSGLFSFSCSPSD